MRYIKEIGGTISVFRLDIRKRFLTERVVAHRSRLPRDVAPAPSL